ncbi:hypothetical protein H5410_021875 [Solanum commersonii]|uniref:Uncharacterized protein n=1 Tax=Solanum commersonii TaxID=4109 RepID=A0A9J5ZD74_SOLCO|nr:hypothetical protein H5410_021875 [Solanum commersonii]
MWLMFCRFRRTQHPIPCNKFATFSSDFILAILLFLRKILDRFIFIYFKKTGKRSIHLLGYKPRWKKREKLYLLTRIKFLTMNTFRKDLNLVAATNKRGLELSRTKGPEVRKKSFKT